MSGASSLAFFWALSIQRIPTNMQKGRGKGRKKWDSSDLSFAVLSPRAAENNNNPPRPALRLLPPAILIAMETIPPPPEPAAATAWPPGSGKTCSSSRLSLSSPPGHLSPSHGQKQRQVAAAVANGGRPGNWLTKYFFVPQSTQVESRPVEDALG